MKDQPIKNVNCDHCGDKCGTGSVFEDSLNFCCSGCKTVYEILADNDLCDYYADGSTPGTSMRSKTYYDKFTVLDDPEIRSKFILFEEGNLVSVKLKLPQIHCSSCIWLLENLQRLNEGVSSSEVNFQKKQLLVNINKSKIDIKELFILLTQIGYEPLINIQETDHSNTSLNITLLLKIGVAAFCFGNIMLYSFPEYLGLDSKEFARFFAYLSLLFSIPLLFYSGFEYLQNAYRGIKMRYVNMDIPIALGMITLFARSSYEIISETGGGYLDSLSGLIFFLLIGKWFQSRTYKTLSFERNYKSYFPLSTTRLENGKRVTVKLDDLKIGDEIIIRNHELIPADGLIKSGEAFLDYSFVTGESELIHKTEKAVVYAGGKQEGSELAILLTHKPDNSYLTQLWNQEAFAKKEDQQINKLADQVSKYFTYFILTITALTAIVWFFLNPALIWTSVTAVLIVACPCALALSIPFTLGNAIRFLGRKGIYLKNTEVIEELAKIDTIVFDKTGTLTTTKSTSISFNNELITEQKELIKSLTTNSNHPLSRSITQFLDKIKTHEVKSFKEITSKGIQGVVNNIEVKIGNEAFLGVAFNKNITTVGVLIDQQYIGCFEFIPLLRKGVPDLISKLDALQIKMSLVSGDNDSMDAFLAEKLKLTDRKFNCSPLDKLNYIKELQEAGIVAMIGDGLNDAGALKQSNIGIAISDDVNYFVPACDIILDSDAISDVHGLLLYSKKCMHIIYASFTLSFIYNIVGLSFAVTGTLSPVIAAILMPISSISVVAFASLTSKYYYHKLIKH